MGSSPTGDAALDPPPSDAGADSSSGSTDGAQDDGDDAGSNDAPDAGQPESIVPTRHLVLEQPGTVDTLRALQDRSFNHTPLQSTGYWVDVGDQLEVTLHVVGATPEPLPALWIHDISDDTWDYETDQKVALTAEQPTVIDVTHRGVLYAALFNEPTGGELSLDLTRGGRVMPRFLAGRHETAQWTEMLTTYADAPYAEIVGARMMVTTTREQAALHAADPNALMALWSEVVRLEDEQYGIVPGHAYPHAPAAHRYHFVELPPYDGWMYAWQYRMAAATEALGAVLDAGELGADGWGPWHELGHQHQLSSITWDDQTEVTVNLSSRYVQRALGLESRYEQMGYYEAAAAYLAQETRDFAQLEDVFVRAIMFWQLDLTFGSDFYAKLAKHVRELPLEARPQSNEERIRFFVVEASRTAGYDLTPFFAQWGVPVDAAAQDALAAMTLRTLDVPIWENRDTLVAYPLTP